MNYIRSHTNEAIRLEDVAAHIDRSTSFIAKKFKSELGFNPGAYISRCKLEEAKKSPYFYGKKSDRNKQLSLLFQSGPLSDCF